MSYVRTEQSTSDPDTLGALAVERLPLLRPLCLLHPLHPPRPSRPLHRLCSLCPLCLPRPLRPLHPLRLLPQLGLQQHLSSAARSLA